MKYIVSMCYNGVWKDFPFATKREAKEFIYKKIIKGCPERNLILKKTDKN